MNIFAFHPSPEISAQAHCDQHLHKMILESAQMLSTAFQYRTPNKLAHTSYIYKPAHPKHPCTQWVSARTEHMQWLISLCESLNTIRLDTGSEGDHASMEVVRYIAAHIPEHTSPPKYFEFCGPAVYKLRQDIDTHKKYQLYYRYKCREWLDTPRPMSYKGRSAPDFMKDYFP